MSSGYINFSSNAVYKCHVYLTKYIIFFVLQLIYDTTETGDCSFGIISLTPHNLKQDEKKRFQRLGVNFPPMM